jgi:hypothetical protein
MSREIGDIMIDLISVICIASVIILPCPIVLMAVLLSK